MILACLALLGVCGMQAQSPFKLMKISKEEVKKLTDNLSKSDAKKVAAIFEDDSEITEEEEARNQNDARREKKKALLKIAKDMNIDYSSQPGMDEKFDSIGVFCLRDGERIEMEPAEATGMDSRLGLGNEKRYRKIDGSTSKYQFAGKAQFRVYFTHSPNSISSKYEMLSNHLTMDDFYIVDLRKNVKRNWREYSDAYTKIGLLKSKMEAGKASEKARMTTSKVRDNVYDVTVEAEPGEYAVAWHNKGETIGDNVFDFTIK